jgi:hypothetical protein
VVRSGALEAGALRAVLLPVSGAFHTALMEPARAALLQVWWFMCSSAQGVAGGEQKQHATPEMGWK